MKAILNIFIVIILIGFGFFAGKWYFEPIPTFKQEKINTVLERVKDAFKIITVEGEISEIYDHKEYWGYDLFPLRKQMLVRAKGKLSVGYDLEEVDIYLDEKTKIVYIGPFKQPIILSVDHDIDYYDISEGFFNSFSAEDYTKIQLKIKEKLMDEKYSIPLMKRAEERRDSLLYTFDDLLEIYGWHIQISEEVKNIIKD